MAKTIAVDFDGVINQYRNGFAGKGVFEEPFKDARESLTRLRDDHGWTIIINTCRSETDQVASYLDYHGIPYDEINHNPTNTKLGLSLAKPVADVYLDDRALQFGGSWKGVVARVLGHRSWLKAQYGNPSLSMEVCGYRVDQMALYVPDLDEAIRAYSRAGHPQWIVDTVVAKDKSGEDKALQFTVNLGFNYTMFPCEFELLELVEGETVQLPLVGRDWGMSHFGFHVDDMDVGIAQFEEGGFELMAHVQTVSHSKCPYLYEYVYMDTSDLGFIAKLIKRI